MPALPAERPPPVPTQLEAGTPGYRRANLAMFVGGFATFAMVYSTQPLLPLLAAEFDVGAASASLTVSATTAGLALMLIPGSVLADRLAQIALDQLDPAQMLMLEDGHCLKDHALAACNRPELRAGARMMGDIAC